MIASGKEFAHPAGAGSTDVAVGPWRSSLRLGLGVFIALAGCGLLASVWRVAGDENRRQAIAAVRRSNTHEAPTSASKRSETWFDRW